MKLAQPRICIIGNLIGRNRGKVTTQGQVLADLLSESGYEVISASSQLNRILRFADIVLTILRRRKAIDIMIVEVYSGLSFLIADVAGLLGRYLRIPTVGVLHGGNLPEFASKKLKRVTRVLRQYDEIVTPSEFLKESFEEIGVAARVIPNVIDFGAYPFRLRADLKPRMIWMRAFHSIYDPELAVEAFSIVRERHEDATLVMAGVDKGLESSVKQKALRLGLADNIRFPGFLDRYSKVAEFAAADIYLNTNTIDNMPVTVLEACAFGVPVIATDVGGIGHLLNDGVSGLLVPPGEASAIADAVDRLLEDRNLASRISKNGRRTAERSSWDSVRPLWERLFDELHPPFQSRARVPASREPSI